MTVSTYRVHAENTAQTLNNLIRNDVIPADDAAVDQLLHSNEEVVDALRHQGCDVGEVSCYRPPDHLSTRTPKATLAGLDEKLTTLVDNIAFAPRTLPLDERRSPADFLAPAPTDPTVKAWRAAAIELPARPAPSRGRPRLSAAIHPGTAHHSRSQCRSIPTEYLCSSRC